MVLIESRDAVCLVREAELFGQGQSGAGYEFESVLFIRIASDTIFAGACRIYKLDLDAVAYSVKMSIEPDLERISGSRATTLITRTIIGTAGRMRFDPIRLTPCNVNAVVLTLLIASGARNAE